MNENALNGVEIEKKSRCGGKCKLFYAHNKGCNICMRHFIHIGSGHSIRGSEKQILARSVHTFAYSKLYFNTAFTRQTSVYSAKNCFAMLSEVLLRSKIQIHSYFFLNRIDQQSSQSTCHMTKKAMVQRRKYACENVYSTSSFALHWNFALDKE